jgi:uncharacterized protein YceK
MKYLIILICIIALGSCGTTRSLERAKLDYELDQLWSEYNYKADSIWIQYNNTISVDAPSLTE